jgi:hypothetical protein
MREHLRWLMAWLHPDENRGDWESVYAERVLRAWREAGTKTSVSSPLAADGPPSVRPKRRSRRLRFPVHRWVALPLEPEPGWRARPLVADWLRSICLRLRLR